MQLWSSILSVIHECIIKIRYFSLNFGYVVVLLTVHLLVYFPFINFTRRLLNFSSHKIDYATMPYVLYHLLLLTFFIKKFDPSSPQGSLEK
jgi:hypothetical protein